MNILHINEQIGIKGGTEVYVLELQKLLPPQGIGSHWIGLRENENGSFQWAVFGEDTEAQVIDATQMKAVLHEFITAKKIDIIHIHNFFSPEILEYLFSLRPMICSPHTPWVVCPGRDKFWRKSENICNKSYGLHCFQHIYTEQCSNRNPLRAWKAWKNVEYVVKKAAPKYKTIMVMSDYVKEECIKGGISASKLTLNPYFTMMPPSNDIATDNCKHILFVGRLISSKGVHFLLSALSPILKQRENVILDIVGDGTMMENIQSQISTHALQEKVILHGWKGREEVEQMMRKAYIVAFPSIYPESFGIVGIEAMMCAKPVVAFDVGGVSTWLKNEETGFLVENKQEKHLGEAIEKLLNDEALAKKMGENGQKMALAHYIPAVHIQKLITIYQNALIS